MSSLKPLPSPAATAPTSDSTSEEAPPLLELPSTSLEWLLASPESLWEFEWREPALKGRATQSGCRNAGRRAPGSAQQPTPSHPRKAQARLPSSSGSTVPTRRCRSMAAMALARLLRSRLVATKTDSLFLSAIIRWISARLSVSSFSAT